MMPAYGSRTQTQPMEGIAVVGEALRRVAPESVEFLIEITAAGASGSQATQNHQTKTAQIAQTVSALGVKDADLQTVSLNVVNGYAPFMQALPAYGGSQIGHGGLGALAAASALQPEVQFGPTHQARSVLRVNVRDAARAGEIADALIMAGATLASGLSYRAGDEAGARQLALDAAVKDARAKAEIVATAAGKKLGDPLGIFEDTWTANAIYPALRAQMPWAFGPDTSLAAGDLEYYARVTASFRLQ